VWTQRSRGKSLVPVGDLTCTHQLVDQRCTEIQGMIVFPINNNSPIINHTFNVIFNLFFNVIVSTLFHSCLMLILYYTILTYYMNCFIRYLCMTIVSFMMYFT
jgi:hypothetical protein